MKSIYRKIVIKCLQKAKQGSAHFRLPGGEKISCGSHSAVYPIEFDIIDERFFRELSTKGGIGLGESYQRGYWKCSDLTEALKWFLINRPYIAPNISPLFAALLKQANSLLNASLHKKNRNTIEGSHQNIHAHYDLGNEFYQTFLDPSMTYSSAYFSSEEDSLEDAQFEKYDRLCRKLGITPMHHILEIGCGWGGFAIHAAKHYNCCVTATTISQEQYNETCRRVNEAGLSDRIHVTMTDYRKLTGKFDRIVSIEMLEAVGQEFLGQYFQQVDSLLANDGLAGIQVITCPNPLYNDMSNGVDWIQKHIFPGSHLPSTHALIENAETSGNLEPYHMESFGLHYARTLREWRIKFMDRWQDIKQQGFDDAFQRKWEYYLTYCEAGFLQRHVNVFQFTFGRADETAYSHEISPARNDIEVKPFAILDAS